MENAIRTEKNQDIRWRTFALLFVALWLINASVRHYYFPLDVPAIEELMFYSGYAIAAFIFGAAVVLPFHWLGRWKNNGFSNPRFLVSIWATGLSLILLVHAVLTR